MGVELGQESNKRNYYVERPLGEGFQSAPIRVDAEAQLDRAIQSHTQAERQRLEPTSVSIPEDVADSVTEIAAPAADVGQTATKATVQPISLHTWRNSK